MHTWKMHMIYELTDPRTSDTRYIGFTSRTLNQRLISHISVAKHYKTKCHKHRWILSLLNANLQPKIAIIEIVEVGVRWQDREIYWIAEYKAKGYKLCNHAGGGEGTLGVTKSPETIEKLRLASIGRKHSPETIEKRSAKMRGRKVSQQAKDKAKATRLNRSPEVQSAINEKIRLSRFGQKHSLTTLIKMKESRKGKLVGYKRSPEAIAKSSESLRGRKLSAEHIAKLSAAAKTRMSNPESRLTISLKLKGRKMDAEVVARRAITQTGRKLSDETKKRISEAHKKRLLPILNDD